MLTSSERVVLLRLAAALLATCSAVSCLDCYKGAVLYNWMIPLDKNESFTTVSDRLFCFVMKQDVSSTKDQAYNNAVSLRYGGENSGMSACKQNVNVTTLDTHIANVTVTLCTCCTNLCNSQNFTCWNKGSKAASGSDNYLATYFPFISTPIFALLLELLTREKPL